MKTLPFVEQKNLSPRQIYEENVRKLWEKVPVEKLDPLSTALGRRRIERSLELLAHPIKGSDVADLGCGMGRLSCHLAERGINVTAVDVVLQGRQHPLVTYRKACIPYLPFSDASFEGVIFTDVIADIDPHLYRLTLSELARIVKKEGWLLCSTPLDLHSYDAADRFTDLIQTEFEIVATRQQFHRLHFYLSRLSQAPSRFVRAAQDKHYRLEQLHKRSSMMRLWFYLHSTKGLSFFWRPITLIFSPFRRYMNQSRTFLLFTEKLSKLLWGEGALTHMILLARKKKI